MLKRIGILSMVLSAGALLQPISAMAAERHANVVEHRDNPHFVQQYRAPARRAPERARTQDWNRAQIAREGTRVVVRTVPSYYYTSAPNCAYGR